MSEQLFVGVSQEGQRQRLAHLLDRAETMVHVARCGYGWAGNVDLYDVAAYRTARIEPFESWGEAWSGHDPTPVRWLQICPRCAPEPLA